MADHRVVLSVDLDDWYHARWATGSPSARWSDPAAARREAAWPDDGLVKPTRSILELFHRHGVTATFFVLGEVAEREPELVREIVGRGHEIACHGLHHVDADMLGPERFSDELAAAKKTLDTLTSQPVIGYRAPNLLVRDWMIRPLREQGFRYDASVCTARALLGKDYGHEHVAVNPYRFRQRFSQPDPEGDLVEIPVPVFPALRLPAATGIMTRVLGKAWTLAALRYALRTGDAQYYFHPYELGSRPAVALGMRERLFMRRVGPWMEGALDRILRKLRSWGVEPTTAASVASQSLGRGGDAVGTHKQTVHDRPRTAGKLTGLTGPIFDGRTVSTLRYWLWWWSRPERSTDGSGPGENGLIAAEQIALITAELEARQAEGLLRKPIDPSSPR